MADLFDEKNIRINELEFLIKKYQKSYYDGEGEILMLNLINCGMN